MSGIDPILMDAMRCMMPREASMFEAKAQFSSLERGELKLVIESLITRLHPDGYEAAEILDALTAAVKRRYDNQLITEARIDEYGTDLRRTFERAYEAA